jgi:hypothetical protein
LSLYHRFNVNQLVLQISKLGMLRSYSIFAELALRILLLESIVCLFILNLKRHVTSFIVQFVVSMIFFIFTSAFACSGRLFLFYKVLSSQVWIELLRFTKSTFVTITSIGLSGKRMRSFRTNIIHFYWFNIFNRFLLCGWHIFLFLHRGSLASILTWCSFFACCFLLCFLLFYLFYHTLFWFTRSLTLKVQI